MSLLRPATVLICVLVVLAGCGGPGDGGDGGENDTGVDEETTEDLEGEDGNETGTDNETGIGEDGNETGTNETDNETGLGNETNETVTADTGDLDVEEVRNNHVESLQEAGSATVVIESDRPSVQERHVVQMDLDSQTTFRRSKVTTDGDENVTVYYTEEGTTYVRDWNESGGPADYRVIEGETNETENDSALDNDTENETENDSTLGNDTENETENDSALGNETNETENDSTLGNETNETENDSTLGNESDVGNGTQGEIAEHQKKYVELQDAFTVIGATNWTEKGEVERNGKNVTLYTAEGADKLDESGIPDNLTSDEGATGADTNETENDSTLGNETNETENDSTLGNETENDSALGNETENETENDSALGNETNETENDSTLGNESDVGSESGVTDYSAVLVVGPDGTIERFSYELTVENESGSQTIEETYNVRDVGETSVSQPGWLELAQERAGATGADTGNETDDMTNESGDLTANESGNMTGNETGDLTGNETGNMTANESGNMTANESGNETEA